MTQDFTGKNVLVTGSSRGIGRAAAERFLSFGANAILVSRTETELFQTAEALRKKFPSRQILAFAMDVGKEEDVLRLYKEIESSLGTLHVLVNNAGTATVKEVVDLTLEEWNQMIRINTTGPFLCSRELFRRAQSQPQISRSIVNISSLAGIQRTNRFSGFAGYVASKFGLTGLTESLAVEGRKWNVRVIAIAPGAVDTEMLRKAAPHLKSLATPEDLARTICYFADEKECKHISGSIVELYTNAVTQ